MTALPGPPGDPVAYPVLDDSQQARLRQYGTTRPVTVGQTLMSQYLIAWVLASERIDVLTASEVVAVEGADHLESVAVRSMAAGAVKQVAASGLYCFIGARPASAWLPEQVARNRSPATGRGSC